MRGHTLLTLDFPPLQDGGIARWMDELARGLAEADCPTTVLTRSRKAAVRAHDAAYPARVVRLPGHGWVRHHARYLRLYAPFLGAHLQDRTLHAATFSVAAPLVRAARRRGATLVVYVHGLELVEPDRDRAGLAAVLGAADVVVANSARARELAVAAGADAARTHVVAPAIDPGRIQPAGDDLRARWGVGQRPVILSLGRLVERKGQDTVLRALPAIRARVPEVTYVIAGRGPDRARLEAIAAEVGVADAVRFVGFVGEAELGAAYRSADVYAMIARETPDDVEGFGITYLEAGAAGRPVVAGRSGGVVDAVIDGVNGLLVEPEDVGAVADALTALLLDPARRAALAAGGRARVEAEMSRAAMIRRLRALTEV